MRQTILRPTGFEFASTDDLQRDEDFARYRGDGKLLLRILLERQHRHWTNQEREQFTGLGERWYRYADQSRSRIGELLEARGARLELRHHGCEGGAASLHMVDINTEVETEVDESSDSWN